MYAAYFINNDSMHSKVNMSQFDSWLTQCNNKLFSLRSKVFYNAVRLISDSLLTWVDQIRHGDRFEASHESTFKIILIKNNYFL